MEINILEGFGGAEWILGVVCSSIGATQKQGSLHQLHQTENKYIQIQRLTRPSVLEYTT